MKYVTAKVFPLDEEGRFQSEPAEAAYQEAKLHGLDRDATRLILQAYECCKDRLHYIREYPPGHQAGTQLTF